MYIEYANLPFFKKLSARHDRYNENVNNQMSITISYCLRSWPNVPNFFWVGGKIRGSLAGKSRLMHARDHHEEEFVICRIDIMPTRILSPI